MRVAAASDRAAVVDLAMTSGLFPPEGAEEIGIVFDAAGGSDQPDAQWAVATVDDLVRGVAFYAPERMTNGTWNLYFLAVDPQHRSAGLGAALVGTAETAVRARQGRVLLIETSGVDGFDRQRAFYSSLGYTLEARIRDFYDDGDDKVVFWKTLTHSAP